MWFGPSPLKWKKSKKKKKNAIQPTSSIVPGGFPPPKGSRQNKKVLWKRNRIQPQIPSNDNNQTASCKLIVVKEESCAILEILQPSTSEDDRSNTEIIENTKNGENAENSANVEKSQKVEKVKVSLQLFKGHLSPIRCVCIYDTETLITSSLDTRIKVWHLVSGECTHTFSYHSFPVNHIKKIRNNGWLITTCVKGSIVLRLNKTQGFAIHGEYNGHAVPITCIDITTSTKDQVMISSDENGHVKIWHLLNGTCLYTLTHLHTSSITSFFILKDQVISASADATIQVWNLKYPENKPMTVSIHTGTIQCLLHLSETTHFISASNDFTVRQFNCLEKNQKKLEKKSCRFYGHKAPVYTLQRLDTHSIVSGAGDGRLLVHDINTQTLQASFHASLTWISHLQVLSKESSVVVHSDGKVNFLHWNGEILKLVDDVDTVVNDMQVTMTGDIILAGDELMVWRRPINASNMVEIRHATLSNE